jgi:hypothetical protein
MTTRNTELACSAFLITVAFLFSAACSAPARPDCSDNNRDSNHPLLIKLKPDKKPKKVVHDKSGEPSADVIHVCRGDKVIWKQKDGVPFEIHFKTDLDGDGLDAKDTPFDWLDETSKPNHELEAIVRADATQDVRLKYTVTASGGDLDPVIIVDR